jgi:hypothetical protein
MRYQKIHLKKSLSPVAINPSHPPIPSGVVEYVFGLLAGQEHSVGINHESCDDLIGHDNRWVRPVFAGGSDPFW